MQRAARFLLWGGLAILIISILSCGAGCVANIGTIAGDQDAENVLIGAVSVSMITGIIGLLMLFTGAILKAVAGSSREDE